MIGSIMSGIGGRTNLKIPVGEPAKGSASAFIAQWRDPKTHPQAIKTVKTAGISSPPSASAASESDNTSTQARAAAMSAIGVPMMSKSTSKSTSGDTEANDQIFIPRVGYVPASKTSSKSTKALSAEEQLQEMYKAQLDDYYQYQEPIIDELTKESESNAIVRLGDIQSNALSGRVRGQTERSLGMDNNNLLPSQKAAMDARMSNDIRLSQGGINRSAQIAQQEHNTATRTNLMSIAESLQTTGVAGVGAAAKAQAERDAAAAKAKGGMLSQVMSIAGGVVGGIYGGPMGAQAGAALGGMAGGAMGG